MTRALSAFAQGCLSRICLAGALLLVSAPALRAGSSTEKSPVVTFGTPGVKQITLQSCNDGGCTSIIKNVTVLDPMPVPLSTIVTPIPAEVGQLVFLTGSGTGKPPLSYSWLVSAGGPPFLGLPGATTWWNTAGMPAGGYLLSLQIQNSVGAVTSLPVYLPLSPPTPLELYTVTPCRIYDTRLGAVPLLSAVARIIPGTGSCGIPANARALAANVTVVGATGSGSVTFYPGNYPQPSTTTVSFSTGDTRSNQTTLPLATTGAGTLSALASIAGSGNVQLVIDVSGYYAP